jgi:hypothetical protein
MVKEDMTLHELGDFRFTVRVGEMSGVFGFDFESGAEEFVNERTVRLGHGIHGLTNLGIARSTVLPVPLVSRLCSRLFKCH